MARSNGKAGATLEAAVDTLVKDERELTIDRIRSLLEGKFGGQCLADVKVNQFSRVELYATPRGLVILNVLRPRKDAGPSFELFVPLTESPRLDLTMEALEAWLAGEPAR